MTAGADILAELRTLGIEARPHGDRLRLRGAAGALTPELQARVLAVKPALLRALSPTHGDGLAVREVLEFPARLLGDLPLPTTLALDVPDVDGPVTVATQARSGPATFDASESSAIVQASEHDRAWPADFATWCGRKRADRGWRLTAGEALGPVCVEPPAGWTVARVLARLGAELRAVVIEGEGAAVHSEAS